MPRITTLNRGAAARMYAAGASLDRLAREYGCSPAYLAKVFRQMGVTIRTPGSGRTEHIEDSGSILPHYDDAVFLRALWRAHPKGAKAP